MTDDLAVASGNPALDPIRVSQAVGGGYEEFWRCKTRYRVLMGGKASKKSSTTALNLLVRLMQNPKANLLVVRQVMDTHRGSTFALLKWAMARLGVTDYFKCTTSPMEITFLPTGQKILFRGMDDVYKLAGLTVSTGVLCWVWIEEAYEIATLDAFATLDLSVPRGRLPAGLYKQTTLTFNPWNRCHWLKSRFFDRPEPNVATFVTDYRCNEFLDDADRRVFERMRKEEPVRYRVAGLGQWGVSEGLVYDRWHVAPFSKQMLADPQTYCHVFGLDYGYSNDPTAFIAGAVDPVARRIYLYDEIWEKKLLNHQIAQKILQLGYGKERIFADAAEPKSNEELRRLGLTRLTAAKKGPDSLRNGIATLQSYEMIVHPLLTHTIAELEAYRWQAGTNQPVDADNHLMDALRYAMQGLQFFHPTMQTPSKKPKSLIRQTDVVGGWA